MCLQFEGLDPAGPGFDYPTIMGLNKSCAQFVQVLHTNPGGMGTRLLRGDADFFANNRSEFQPGCTTKDCGHANAVYFYYASLFPQNIFIGGDCSQLDEIYSTTTSIFGSCCDEKNGVFCFQTTPCLPYARSIDVKPEKKNCHRCRTHRSKKKKVNHRKLDADN